MARLRLLYADRPAEGFEASPALSILVAAQRAGVPLRHDCGGKALCGTCRVRVLSGRLSPASDRERSRLAESGAGSDERLACQARAGTDLELEAVLPTGRPENPGRPEREGAEGR